MEFNKAKCKVPYLARKVEQPLSLKILRGQAGKNLEQCGLIL